MFSLTGFLLYSFVMVFSPGPNNLMCLAYSGRLGLKKSFSFVVGISIGVSVIMLASMLFGALLYQLIPSIKFPMLCLGALYILWMAWKSFTSKESFQTCENPEKNLLSSGIFLQFVNPKVYIYGIMSFSAYVLPYFHKIHELLAWVLVTIIIGFIANASWWLGGSFLYPLFRSHSKIANIVIGLLLVYCAVSLFL